MLVFVPIFKVCVYMCVCVCVCVCYRTAECLLKHLARVASHDVETGMHCKNLAIVWAPNLLR